MADKKTSLKNKQRAAAVDCAPTDTVIGSRITQLTNLDTDLIALADMSLAALRARWQEVNDKPVPRVRQTLLRLALAYELQAAAHGLSRRWWQQIAETGIDLSTLAALEGVSPSYIVRVLRLAFLSPAVVEAVLDRRLRAGIDSFALLNIRAIDPSSEDRERRCMLRK